MPESLLNEEVIGLIPAGGLATRIAPLPCSKEVYPIALRETDLNGGARPKVVCHYLLEKMRLAGITKAHIVLREGKWDIPQYLRDGALVGMHLSYLVLRLPFGAPYTLDEAYPFVQHSVIAFGFPDIIFQPDDAFVQLLARRTTTKADVMLGLFPAEEPGKVDMVDLGDGGRVRRIIIKPDVTHLSFTWGIGVWTPAFSKFLHEYVAARQATALTRPEATVGEVLQASIEAGLTVEAAPVSADPYLDIGTPENLARAVRYSANS